MSESAAAKKPARARKTRARSKPSAARSRPGGTRATGAERRDRIITLIRERPGITVPDISKEIGIDAPPIYRVIRKLVSDGVVEKDGKRLALA